MEIKRRPCRSGPPAASAGFLRLLWLAWACATVGLRAGEPDPGVYYTNEVVASVPWSINILRIDRARHDLRFTTTLGGGKVLGMGIVSGQVRSVPAGAGLPLGAINGDFYEKAKDYPGRPRDLQIRDGEVLTQPTGHTCFWIDRDGQPHMTNIVSRFRVIWPDGKTTPFGMNQERTNGTAVLYTSVLGASTLTAGGLEYVLEQSPGRDWLPLRAGQRYTARIRNVNAAGNSPIEPRTAVLSLSPALLPQTPVLKPGATLELATESVPDLSGVEVAIGGGPSLVRDGQIEKWNGWIHLPQPRTALGWNKRYFFLVEVDGRQLDLSLGMTFTQLAKYMLELGCDEAMNLDGGGSATLWAFGVVKNSPSEGQERAAPNALVVVRPNPTTVAK